MLPQQPHLLHYIFLRLHLYFVHACFYNLLWQQVQDVHRLLHEPSSVLNWHPNCFHQALPTSHLADFIMAAPHSACPLLSWLGKCWSWPLLTFFLTKLRKLCIVGQLLNPINHFTCLFMYFTWHYHVLLKMWQWGIPLNALHRATQPPFPKFLVLPPKNTMDKYPSCGFQPKNTFSIHNYTAIFYSSYSIFCPVTELAQSIVFLSIHLIYTSIYSTTTWTEWCKDDFFFVLYCTAPSTIWSWFRRQAFRCLSYQGTPLLPDNKGLKNTYNNTHHNAILVKDIMIKTLARLELRHYACLIFLFT